MAQHRAQGTKQYGRQQNQYGDCQCRTNMAANRNNMETVSVKPIWSPTEKQYGRQQKNNMETVSVKTLYDCQINMACKRGDKIEYVC